MAEPETASLRLDWRIPVASIAAAGFAVTCSLATVVWMTAHRDASLDDHERRLSRMEASMSETGRAVTEMQRQLALVDQRLLFLVERLTPRPAGRP